MINKNLATAILWATVLVFRAHASDSLVLSFEQFPDDIRKAIVYHMNPEILHPFAFVSKGSTDLVKNALQKRLPPLIESLSILPAEYDVLVSNSKKAFYPTLVRKDPDTNVLGAWDHKLFQAQFNELFLLKEMRMFHRVDLPPEFQELLGYTKPMLTVAVLTPDSEECLYLGIQGAYILLTKPQTVSCPVIDAFYIKNDDHQNTYLFPKIAKTIENVCRHVLSKKGTLDLLHDMCSGMIATSIINQYPLTFDDVRKTGRILTKITHQIHYPGKAHLTFLVAIVSSSIELNNESGSRFVTMGDHKPRTRYEKCADFDLLRMVCSYFDKDLKFDMKYDVPNSKESKHLSDYEAAIYNDEEAARFKESIVLDELFDD